MTDIRTSLPIPTQPWEAARESFYEGLLPHERDLYSNATLENIFHDASSSQNSHIRGSRTWRLQERLAPLVESLEEYGKAMDVFVNTCPLILSPLWGSLRLVLLIAAEAAKFQESLVDMLAQIGDILPRFRVYERLFKNHERLLVALSAIYLDVLRFCVASKDLFVKARRSRISLSIVLRGTWKSHLREFDTYMSKFRAHSKRVEKETGLAHMIESARTRDIETQNRALQLRNAKYEKRNRVLASIPAVNYINKQSKLSSSKHPGTCEWLQSNPEIEVWYVRPSSTCMCCYGIPGSGKSVIAASVRDFILERSSNDKNELVCYYYCDYSDKPSLSMTHVIGSVIKQVLEHLDLDHFGEDFSCPYRDDRDPPTHDEGSRYLLGLLSKYDTTYLVLDGIDELDAANQTQLLALIDFLINPTSGTVKIFVTSRTEEFRVKKSLKTYSAIHLSSKHVNDDIAMFIEDEIDKISDPHPLASNAELRYEVIQILVKGAKGLFLWAKFQLLDIKEASTKSDLRTILENLPESLSDTYLRIITRTYRGPRGQAKLDTMRKAFRWIAMARRPLHIYELEEAIALESTDTYLHVDRLPKNAGAKLVSDCGNLVVLNNSDNTVVFAHYTVEQFLFSVQKYGSRLSELIDLTSSDVEVGKICLAYLNFSDFQTQLAKTPAQINVETHLAEAIIWSSVPLGGYIKALLSWITSWRTKAGNSKEAPLKFAVPVRSSPTETLHRKYALLEYIIEYWVYHTSGLRSHSTEWSKFRHLALYRQLDFEFRPWNDSTHQKKTKSIVEMSKQKIERLRRKRLFSPSTDDYFAQLAVYGWAMRHNIGSLFALLDPKILGMYFYMICIDILPDISNFEATLDTRYDGLQVLIRCLQMASSPREQDLLNNSQPYATGWCGTSVVRLLQTALNELDNKRLRVDAFGHFDDYFKIEITRWAGPNTWTELWIDAAVCAMRYNKRPAFECVWRRCIDDTPMFKPHGIDWRTSTSFKAIEALLCEATSPFPSAHIEWAIFHIPRLYLTSQQLRWTIEHSPTCKSNASIGQTLLVVALDSKLPVRHIIELWTKLGLSSLAVRPFDPVGDPEASEFRERVTWRGVKLSTPHKFLRINVLALVEQLSHVLEQRANILSISDLETAINEFVSLIYTITDLWKKFERCFSVAIFENDGIGLLRWTVEQRKVAAAHALVPLYQQYWTHGVDRGLLRKLKNISRERGDEMLQVLALID